jgi:hypothetical protein
MDAAPDLISLGDIGRGVVNRFRRLRLPRRRRAQPGHEPERAPTTADLRYRDALIYGGADDLVAYWVQLPEAELLRMVGLNARYAPEESAITGAKWRWTAASFGMTSALFTAMFWPLGQPILAAIMGCALALPVSVVLGWVVLGRIMAPRELWMVRLTGDRAEAIRPPLLHVSTSGAPSNGDDLAALTAPADVMYEIRLMDDERRDFAGPPHGREKLLQIGSMVIIVVALVVGVIMAQAIATG